MTKYNGICVFNLISEKFTEILHIHFAFFCINYRCISTEYSTLSICIFNSRDNVRKLSNSRRLNYNSVGRKLCDNLTKRLAEIANERAAYTARIHFGYFNARIFEKSTVDAYFAKLIFNENDLLTLVCLGDKLLYECCLTCSQKS